MFLILKDDMYERELLGLSNAGVRYLVVGAIALGLHGYPRATFDLDILPDIDKKNLDVLVKTLTAIGYRSIYPINPNDIKNKKKRESWIKEKRMQVFPFQDINDERNIVDVMIDYPFAFEDAFKRRSVIEIEGVEIYIAGPQDLLTLKKTYIRDEKDSGDVSVLERIIERRKHGK